jgi:hypothetical protein
MFYCDKCKILCDIKKCSYCSNKKLIEPNEKTMIYLTHKNSVWSEAVEDVLTQNSIPYIKECVFKADGIPGGLAIITGHLHGQVVDAEMNNFYVSFESCERAKELLAEVFPKDFKE